MGKKNKKNSASAKGSSEAGEVAPVQSVVTETPIAKQTENLPHQAPASELDDGAPTDIAVEDIAPVQGVVNETPRAKQTENLPHDPASQLDDGAPTDISIEDVSLDVDKTSTVTSEFRENGSSTPSECIETGVELTQVSTSFSHGGLLKTPDSVLADKGVSVRAIQQEMEDVVFRKKLFVALCILQLFMNFDSGVVPSALTAIKDEFEFTNAEAGALGSLVYVGLVFSCPVTGYLLSTWKSQRKVLLLSLFLNMLALILFALVRDGRWLMFSRFLTGLSQAPLFVYPPVWVDEFAPQASLTTWVSSLQGMAPLGVMLGYVLTMAFTSSSGSRMGWRTTIWVQVICLIPYFVMYLKMPGRYFNALGGELARLVDQHNKIQQQEDSARDLSFEKKQAKSSEECLLQGPLSDSTDNDLEAPSPPKHRRQKSDPINTRGTNEPEPLGVLQQLRKLITSALYMWLVFGLAGLYFVVTGIQFWVTDYMVVVLKQELVTVQTGFAICSITGPILGVFFGGWLIDKLGGYKDDSGESGVVALRTCGLLGIGAVTFAMVASGSTDFWTVLISIWMILFFGGAILPALSGMLINAVGDDCRAMASSFSMFMFNIFGYAAAPYVCGAIGDLTGSMLWGFRSIMYTACLAILFVAGAYFAVKAKVAKGKMKNRTTRIRRASTFQMESTSHQKDHADVRSGMGMGDGDHTATQNMSKIARGINSRSSISPNFFGFLDNLHEHDRDGMADIETNFEARLSASDMIEEDGEEEDAF